MESLEAIAASHARHGHIQEVILQNFVPHPRYYGREVADIADEAASERWAGDGSPLGDEEAHAVVGVRSDPRGHEAAGRGDEAAHARRRHPDPAEPRRVVGRAGRGGRHRPRRPVGQRRPHLARARLPEPASGPKAPRPAGLRSDRAPLRLPAVPRPGVDGAGRARRRQAQVLELHPAPRLRAAHGQGRRSGAGAGGDRARAARAGAERGRAGGAVRRDAPRGDRGDARRRR